MKQLLNEIGKIRQIMSIDESEKTSEEIFSSIKSILTANELYKKGVITLLDRIVKHSEKNLINLTLLDRGIRATLLKKGDKYKNMTKYLGKVYNSLEKRDPESFKHEPELPEYDFEVEEPSILGKKVFKKELYYLQVELLKLQEWLRKTNKTVIIVFEGRDSAGKGSTIKKFTENLNPRYYNVIALGIPTPEEKKNWWDRYKNQIQSGKINFFDRSWYNRGLVDPVMGYGTPEEYEDFMENVENFENDLVKEGDYLFKLWFSIDKETQARRFQMRQQSPLKYWKYSPNDARMQDLWDRFTEFKERLFDKTSTVNHPWVILDSTDKRISGLNSIRYVLNNIPYEGKNEELLTKDFPEAMMVLKPEN